MVGTESGVKLQAIETFWALNLFEGWIFTMHDYGHPNLTISHITNGSKFHAFDNSTNSGFLTSMKTVNYLFRTLEKYGVNDQYHWPWQTLRGFKLDQWTL